MDKLRFFTLQSLVCNFSCRALLLHFLKMKSLIDNYVMVVFKMLQSVPSARYSNICNALHQWKNRVTTTYRLYGESIL